MLEILIHSEQTVLSALTSAHRVGIVLRSMGWKIPFIFIEKPLKVAQFLARMDSLMGATFKWFVH
jgi:hypothetical protein